jgi:hypothetical protein
MPQIDISDVHSPFNADVCRIEIAGGAESSNYDLVSALDSLNLLITKIVPALANQVINRKIAYWWEPVVVDFSSFAHNSS